MKFSIVLLLFFFSIHIHAAETFYEIEVEFAIDEEDSSTGTILISEDKTGSFEMNSQYGWVRYDVIAKDLDINGQDAIQMKFDVQYENFESGDFIAIKPSVASLPGKEASIQIKDDSHDFQMKVVATRKLL